MEGVERQGRLEGGDGRLILLPLRVEQPQEIMGIGIPRVKLRHPLERFQRRLGFAQVPIEQAQVVPDSRVSRFLLTYFKQGSARGVVALEVEQGDALVEPGGVKLRLYLVGLLELLQRPLKALLVHVGHAQVVEPDGFGGGTLAARRSRGSFPRTGRGNSGGGKRRKREEADGSNTKAPGEEAQGLFSLPRF